MKQELFYALGRSTLTAFRDLVFLFASVRTIESQRETAGWKKAVVYIAVVLLYGMLIVSSSSMRQEIPMLNEIPTLLYSLLRIAIRFGACWLLLRGTKQISVVTELYDAALIYAALVISHNIFLTPSTRPVLNAEVELVTGKLLNNLLCAGIVNGVSAILLYVVYKLIPLRDIKSCDKESLWMLLLFAGGSQYMNASQKIIVSSGGRQEWLYSSYLILLQLFLLTCIVAYERYRESHWAWMRTELENRAAHALMENIEEQKQSEELMRQMRHDLKNHIIAIRQLIENDRKEDALRYLDTLGKDYMQYRTRIQTGNLVLDGILVQKMAIAQKNQIEISIVADFSFLNGMEETDLCVLFGNLLDNALEACVRMENGQRFINIRARQVGETILYVIENSCPEAAPGEFVLKTRKKDAGNHGIGHTSIQRVVKKYAGTVQFSQKKDVFTVICGFQIPLPMPVK